MTDSNEQLIVSNVDGILMVSGELDAHSAPRLIDALSHIDGNNAVVDMSGVEFVDSSGLRVLIDAHQAAEALGGRFIIRRPSATVTRLFDISGVADYLHIVAD
ncbi:MAG TPA: STAS domain-containing protein [Ilumatobacter sp.]|nr:STAS domain-containing protein [Ilumatobacter sp.]